jgi:transcriptional regulator with XRE-family HTH domain
MMKKPSKLRLLRLTLGLSQAELGKAIGVTQGMISQLELDKIRPGEALQRKIVEAFHCDPQLIFPER